jgi:hypothetical protein
VTVAVVAATAACVHQTGAFVLPALRTSDRHFGANKVDFVCEFLATVSAAQPRLFRHNDVEGRKQKATYFSMELRK